jgi:phage terminase Nu1 subunit (DNA packaging protein)
MIGRPIAVILDSLPTLSKEDYHVVMIGRPIAAILGRVPTLSKEDYHVIMIGRSIDSFYSPSPRKTILVPFRRHLG